SVVVNKQISMLRQSGSTVFITGNLTVTNVTAPVTNAIIVSNLKIGGDSTKKLLLWNCTNLVADNLDLTAGGFNASDCVNVSVGNSSIQYAQMWRSTINFSRDYVKDYVLIDNTATTNRALNVLQCTITNSPNSSRIEVQGGFGRVLYSVVGRTVTSSSADCV